MRKYKLAQIEAFRSIVACGSFQGAATRLNVTQPTISLRIRELESAVGRNLLDREAGRVALTAEGQVFLHYTDRIVGMLDEMDRRMHSGDPLQGVLRLGSSEIFAISCLPDILSQLEETYPHLRLELTIASSARLAQLLDSRLIDMAFMTTTPVQPHVQRSPLANCPLAWFASSAHHNLQRVLSPADVARERILTLPPNSPLNTTMVKWFESNAHPVPVLSTCTDLGVILRLVRSGYAWSVLPLCFTLAHEESMVPSPVSIGSPLPALQLCSAFQIEAAQDTLQLVVEMAKSIVRRKPGLAPV